MPSSTTLPNSETPNPHYPPHSIAVVGMAGRFPSADTVDELWNLIKHAKSAAQPAPIDRLGLPTTGEYAETKWWGNFLNDPHSFDHKFFKKSSREALASDPQQRILLEVVYEALESSGYFGPSGISGSEPSDYGCYIGVFTNDYTDNLSCHGPNAYSVLGPSRFAVSGAVSYQFGWTGPSLSIDTACSSSMVAIHTACRAILSGECSRAVAGGSNVISSPFDYQNLKAGGFLSPSGQCKPFSSDADGYCRGEGVAVVVLKPLSAALAEKDNILGVILASAISQSERVSNITVPNSSSQAKIYRKVIKLGGVEPEDVTYVEAHGTGMSVGDPIEAQSIRDALGDSGRRSLLYFSSIKGNIGHTEGTSGVSGLIKVLLMMKHRMIPPQASHTSLNPNILDLGLDGLAIPRQIIPWQGSSLLALVNSYGAAGSTTACVVREGPARKPVAAPSKLAKYPIFISAGSSSCLSRFANRLLSWIQDSQADLRPDLGALAFNLADRGNHSLPYFFATTVGSIGELKTKLEATAATHSEIITSPSSQRVKPVILVFGGQETDFIGLSEEVYRTSKVFRDHLDSVNDILMTSGFESFYPAIFQSTPIQNLVTLHSALFAVQFASAKSWMHCGLEVSAVVGHSFGQLTAFCISGVLSLSDAVKLVSGRASLMETHWGVESGSMLSVQVDRETVEGIIRELNSKHRDMDIYLEMACYNGPKSHVVTGSAKAIDILQHHVARETHFQSSEAIKTKRLNITNGFHSRLTESLLPYLSTLAQELEWNAPTMHLETTNEHRTISEPDFTIVSDHTRRPVFFQQAIERLTVIYSRSTWIEAGGSSSVLNMVKNCVGDYDQHKFHSPQLPSRKAQDSFADMTVDLWKSGYAVQFWPFHRIQKPEYQHLSLPPIQFEKTRHWLPFTGRGSIQDTEATENDIEEAHDVLTFIEFQDTSKKQALFNIDPQTDRFQQTVTGHMVAGEPLAPSSLYFEMVARAALHLMSDTEATKYVPTVDDLCIKSPIGQSTTDKISLVLAKNNDVRGPTWSFSISSQETKHPPSSPLEHCTGSITLKKRNDKQSAREFARFGQLTGHKRIQELIGNPAAERMQGSHIYRAFNNIVQYGQSFHGIKHIACVGLEAVSKVKISSPIQDAADQRLVDAHTTDGLLQIAAFLVAYFNNDNVQDVFVCSKIDRIEMGGGWDPDAGEWEVYATMSSCNENGVGHVSADVYVFDVRTNKMVMIFFGMHFSKIARMTLTRMLKGSKVEPGVRKAVLEKGPVSTVDAPETHAAEQPRIHVTTKGLVGKRKEIIQVLSGVTDVPIQDIRDDSTLGELGIDSLMATEAVSDIRAAMGFTIDLSTFLFFPDVGSLVSHIDEILGLGGSKEFDDSTDAESSSRSTRTSTSHGESSTTGLSDSHIKGNKPETAQSETTEVTEQTTSSARPSLEAFEATRFTFDQHGQATGALDFWTKEYPRQSRLILAYVVEGFASLGCDLSILQPGDPVPNITSNTLAKHHKLVRQLYCIVRDGGLISDDNEQAMDQNFVRTAKPVDETPAKEIFTQIVKDNINPQFKSITTLVQSVGSELAPCLRGDKEGLQVIFGNRDTKRTLEDMYEFSPLFRTATMVLGDFLVDAFGHRSSRVRILEIGAGTGGTTRYIVDFLRQNGVEFEYVFSDISGSLVNAAAKAFNESDRVHSAGGQIKFEVVDVEQAPDEKYHGAFDCIIATNCIHATRDLSVSLGNIRKMLKAEDGFAALIEMTRNMVWTDIVVGLLEGWWLFDDGRTHALVDEIHWERRMSGVGFDEVRWSEGVSEESRTVRVICGFQNGMNEAHEDRKGRDRRTEVGALKEVKAVKAAMETVVYKRVEHLEIHADIYCPLEVENKDQKLPVALMIHGGSHMLLSRKDIRPSQTRLLLSQGFLPISIDYRLCPEVSLLSGPMVDVLDALQWIHAHLPSQPILQSHDIQINPDKTVVIGWSSGGHLAMSLGWTAPCLNLPSPTAALVFYAPTDYQDPWFMSPISPIDAPYTGQEYEVLAGVNDTPIANHNGAWKDPISDPQSWSDPRCRILRHINWKAQTLPVLLSGLPSKSQCDNIMNEKEKGEKVDWNNLPKPSDEIIQAASPRHHITEGRYAVPTFFIHGTEDDLIPWQQSQGTYQALVERGVDSQLVLLDGAGHICDLSSEPESNGWKAVLRGYEFLGGYV